MIDAPQQIAEEVVVVNETSDREVLRRWMLRPAFLAKMGAGQLEKAEVEVAFEAITASANRFFVVNVRGEEKGCIVLVRAPHHWQLHLCLATWLTHTRVAIRKMLSRIGLNEIVVAKYDHARRSIDKLLDDVGFSAGTDDGVWTTRSIAL